MSPPQIITKMSIDRYIRLKNIPEIGDKGMRAIGDFKVLVIGCGALGSMCAMQLAASGVGTIGIADFDTIDLTNLQRQLFFAETQLGKSKSQVLSERMKALNSEIEIIRYPELVTPNKARILFPDFEFIIDGSDNPTTKAMTSKVCEELQIPYCIGGVDGFRGQAMSWAPGCMGWRDIFGEEAISCGLTPCSVAGVLGSTAAIIASVQAAEAVKYAAKAGELLFNRLLMFDIAGPSCRILKIG